MPAHAIELVAAVVAMVLLTFVVGARMLQCRAGELARSRIPLRKVATSQGAASHYEDTRAADNFRNLFEVPVLFYALVAVALAIGPVPGWLVAGAWVFVGLRVAHSLIHCTYNRVTHRLAAFAAGLVLLVVMWVALLVGIVSR